MKFLLILSALLLIQAEAKPKAKPAAPVAEAITPDYQVQIKDLMKRMTELESTVSALQRKIVEMEGNTKQASETGWTTCTIHTTFDGEFSATEPTRTSAMNKVVENCKAKAGGASIYCDKEKAVCGK